MFVIIGMQDNIHLLVAKGGCTRRNGDDFAWIVCSASKF